MRVVITILMWIISGTLLNAQTSCSAYVGTIVKPLSFSALYAVASKVPVTKGEFETTEAFEARISAATKDSHKAVIVRGAPPGRELLKYDANSNKLIVHSYALANLGADYSTVFGYGTPFDGQVDFSEVENNDAVVYQSERNVGTYVASNVFGASMRVTKITRRTYAIFDRPSKPMESLFRSMDSDGILDRIPLSPADAKQFEANARVAFVIVPKYPYAASGVENSGPTIDSPTDVTEHMSVVIADIRCGLLLTGTNKVIAAYETTDATSNPLNGSPKAGGPGLTHH